MAPKAKPKAKPKNKANAKAAAVEPTAKAAPAAGSPAAGSGAAAVRQSKLDADSEHTLVAPAPHDVEAAAEAKDEAETLPAGSATDAANVEPTAPTEASSGGENAKAAVAKAETEADISPSAPATAEPALAVEASSGGDDIAKAAEAETETKVNLSDIPDPWGKTTDDTAMVRIRKEEWEILELGDEPSAPGHLAARDADLSVFLPAEAQRRQLVSADFSGNALPNVSAAGGPMWLRSLGLANNPLESLMGLSDSFPRLLSLDISFIELSSIDGAWRALAACPCLRRLTIEGCSLASFEEMEPMPKLQMLEAQDNDIETLEDVEVLQGRCPGLLELDLRENDVTTEAGYTKKVKALFQKLTSFDSQPQKAYVAKRQDEAYKNVSVADKQINAVDGMWKNEGCSCLEGNPCVDAACCKDWKNREAVAAEARKRKGLRDDFGKQL